jgi:hypothetical protein
MAGKTSHPYSTRIPGLGWETFQILLAKLTQLLLSVMVRRMLCWDS